jgi:hypothetical protein
MRKLLLLLLFLFICSTYAQEIPIEIIKEKQANRMMFYAVNKNEQDVDILFSVEGSYIRQSKRKPRLIRVPAASKVHLHNVIVEKGKNPYFTYNLVVNDSLSRRALKKEFTPIKIKPKKFITMYIPDECIDSYMILDSLDQSRYLYTEILINEKPIVKETIGKLLKYHETPLDSLRNPLVSLGGAIFPNIKTYSELVEEIRKN